jgi:hypothetical protein
MAAKPSVAPPVVQLANDEPTLAHLVQLGEIQCTAAEAACVLGVALETLDTFFSDYPTAKAAFEVARGRGLEALRKAQFKLAATNAAMAMFLGKNYLDQTDRREVEQSGAIDVSHALQRLRDKLAVIDAAAQAEEVHEGD